MRTLLEILACPVIHAAALQEASAIEKHSSVLLLLCARLLAAHSGKQHFAAAAVNSNQISWQCCAVDLLYADAAVPGAKSAAGTHHGTGNGALHS